MIEQLEDADKLKDFYAARQAFLAACALPSKHTRKFEDFTLDRSGKKKTLDPIAHAEACERLIKNGQT